MKIIRVIFTSLLLVFLNTISAHSVTNETLYDTCIGYVENNFKVRTDNENDFSDDMICKSFTQAIFTLQGSDSCSDNSIVELKILGERVKLEYEKRNEYLSHYMKTIETQPAIGSQLASQWLVFSMKIVSGPC